MLLHKKNRKSKIGNQHLLVEILGRNKRNTQAFLWMWSSVSLVTLDYFSSQSTPLLYRHMYELIWLWWVVLHVFQLLCHLFCFNYCAKWAFNNSQLETEIFKVCSSPPKECALNSQHQHIMARAHSTVFSNENLFNFSQLIHLFFASFCFRLIMQEVLFLHVNIVF